MVNIRDIEKQFLNSPVAQGEMDQRVQLGFPWLYIKERRLCLRYLPHLEDCFDGRLFIHPPACKLDLICPRARLLSYSAYDMRSRGYYGEPLYIIDAGWQIETRISAADALYEQCDNVLACVEEVFSNSLEKDWNLGYIWTDIEDIDRIKGLVNDYQNFFRETVLKLGLDSLYGGIENDAT